MMDVKPYQFLNIQNECNNLLKLYKHSFLFLLLDNAGILKNPGNKYNTKGLNIDNPKLIKVSFNKCI